MVENSTIGTVIKRLDIIEKYPPNMGIISKKDLYVIVVFSIGNYKFNYKTIVVIGFSYVSTKCLFSNM